MFQDTRKQSSFSSALSLIEVIYHSTVRNVRKSHENAIMALVMNMLQAAIFVLAFYVMFSILGLRGTALRGDFLIYLMSGIFLFMTHIKTISAVSTADGPSSPMMQHSPMNTIVSILSAALATLYIQVSSLFVILFIYHVAFKPVVIDQPIPAFGMLLLSWLTGMAIGIVLLALRPWAPSFVSIFSTVLQRANMIASGKMFIANALPTFMLKMFDWNPLFHAIDQARGFAFINYNPRYTSVEYPIYIAIVLIMIGLMGEFYTRRHASVSWGARQ